MSTNNIPLDPWQEPLANLTTVPATKVLEASEILQGFIGSWAGSYAFDTGTSGDISSADISTPNPRRIKKSKIGDPGHPEINFAPYNFRTNRFGPKGGSLIGHPISFEPVGPTLKAPDSDSYYWVLQQGTGTTGDTFTLACGGFTAMLDIFGIDILDRFPGGLYVFINQTGDEGPFTGGGVGDGNSMVPDLTPNSASSKGEIFRVVAVRASELTLDYTKRVGTYFTAAANPCSVRGVTIVQPRATRMTAIPEPGVAKGHEKTFAVVSPVRALNTDEQYPYKDWLAGFTEYWLANGGSTMPVGLPFDYRNKPSLPVPRPKGHTAARLYGGVPVVLQAGWMRLLEAAAELVVGDIIRVFDIKIVGNAGLTTNVATGKRASLDVLLGWFEVMATPGGGETWVRRMEECNPTTGATFFGTPELLTQEIAVTPTDYIELVCTVHSPVTTLWNNAVTGNYFDVDAVDSARLTNIINPDWVESTMKSMGVEDAGINPGRADRAVFDTKGPGTPGNNVNPGNLLDLGFRMVLFPAMEHLVDDPAGAPLSLSVTGPDWSRPITSNEVVLDPSKLDEKQFITVDYSNGLVRLSHAPQTGSDLDATSYGADNPREELVLFACCVPYSMEEGQLGSGVRVTGSDALPVTGACVADPTGSPEHADVYSNRFFAALSTQVINSSRGAGTTITLQGWVADQIPPGGFVELVWGETPYGDPLFSVGVSGLRGSIFGYAGVVEAVVGPDNVTNLTGCYGGGILATAATVDSTHPASAVFRREFLTPQTATGTIGVEYQYDTTYGSAKRANALRFEYSGTRVNTDGSVSVIDQNPTTGDQTHLFDDLFSSWLIRDGALTTNIVGADITCTVAPATIIKEGVRQSPPALSMMITPVGLGVHYLYYTSLPGDCVTLAVATTLPLPSPEDILLWKVEVLGIGPITITTTDLRAPLQDVDKRVDLYVGERAPLGEAGDWLAYRPNFATLSEAIGYANEIGNPDGGEGVAQIRIFVVGPTWEQDGTYPIQIKTDGIIIESAAKESTAIPYTEICWGDEAAATAREPLLDLNGHSNIVIRGVAFRYLWQGGALPTDADPLGAFVLTNKAAGSTCTNITLENCRLAEGDGFFTVNLGDCVNLQIKKNVGLTLYTSGVHVRLASGLKQCVIKDNTFWGIAAQSGWPLADVTSGIQIEGIGPVLSAGRDITIDRNDIRRFNHGIFASASGSGIATPSSDIGGINVRHNRIWDTRGPGALIIGLVGEVAYNFLYNVHLDIPPVTVPRTWRAGMKISTLLVNYSMQGFEVMGNSIYMASDFDTAIPGAALYVTTEMAVTKAAPGIIRRNDSHVVGAVGIHIAPVSVLAGTGCVLESHSDNWIVVGQGNSIVHNSMPRIFVNYDHYGWFVETTYTPETFIDIYESNYVAHNTFEFTVSPDGTLTVFGVKTVLEGNRIEGTGTLGIGCYVNDDCRLVDNYIEHLKTPYFWPDPVTPTLRKANDLLMMGNTVIHVGEDVAGTEDGGLFGKAQVWESNIIRATGLALSEAQVLFTGNRFDATSSVTLLVGETAVVNSNEFLSVGDIIVTVTSGTIVGNVVQSFNGDVTVLCGTDDSATVVGDNKVSTAKSGGAASLEVQGTLCTVSGNRVSHLLVSAERTTVQGNNVGPTIDPYYALDIGGTKCTVTGNYVMGTLRVIWNNATPIIDDVTIQGNRVETSGAGDIRIECNSNLTIYPNFLVLGNWVENDIVLYDVFAFASVAPPGTVHYVCQGNRATNVLTLNPNPTQYPIPALVDDYNID